MKIYLVGGAVRDKLLNYPCDEQDWVVVGASPAEMLENSFKPVGKDFPVFLHPETNEEYALARTERKTGHGYAGFDFHTAKNVSLEDDLARRDLTVNAIALSPDGDYIDPYSGRKDIADKVLRHVSPAFAEDPVRILRVARFAARYHKLGFTIANETLTLMQGMVSDGEADHLVPERVWKEFSRALTESTPEIFIRSLRDCNALARLLPELDNLFGVPQPAKHHPEIDTGEHSLLCLREAAKYTHSATVRFASLMHDLGKGTTPKEEWPSHHGHEQRSLPLVKSLCSRLAIPNEYRDLALIVAEFHTHCHRAFELQAKTLLKTLERLDALRRPERFAEFLLCCKADACGRTGFEDQAYPQADYFSGAFKTISKISAKAFAEQGLKGQDLGDALRSARLHALIEYKEENPRE